MKEPTVQLWTRVPITIAAGLQSLCIAGNTNPSDLLRQLVTAAVEKSAPVAAAAHRELRKAPHRTKKAVRK